MVNRFSAEWLQARSEIVALLVKHGIIETQNDVAGFWVGDTWKSIYDLLEENND